MSKIGKEWKWNEFRKIMTVAHVGSLHNKKLFDFSKVKENCSIYVCTSAIPEFVKMIDKINVKFYLVSGDADEDFPTDILTDNADKAIIRGRRYFFMCYKYFNRRNLYNLQFLNLNHL